MFAPFSIRALKALLLGAVAALAAGGASAQSLTASAVLTLTGTVQKNCDIRFDTTTGATAQTFNLDSALSSGSGSSPAACTVGENCSTAYKVDLKTDNGFSLKGAGVATPAIN